MREGCKGDDVAMQAKPFKLAFERHADPDTGRRVTRLLPRGRVGSHAYFTSTSFDSRGDLILSITCDDRAQLCRVAAASGAAEQITDLDGMRLQSYCLSPAIDCALVQVGDRLVRVDLGNGDAAPVFQAPQGWNVGLPTIDAAGSRAAFVVSERTPGFTSTARIYSTMPENFFFRPRSLVCCLDMASGAVSVAWGETAWISHVLINPVAPDTIVFCHEGGSLAQNRLWTVDARRLWKKTARPLYQERLEDFLVHEYFVANGTLGVQRSWYAPGAPGEADGNYAGNSILFLDRNGDRVAEYVLPGRRSGHVQSNADNSRLVADGCFTGDPAQDADGNAHLALHIPDGDRLRVERLCRHGSSWTTQLSHPHPIFAPDGRTILFSSDDGGSNSPYLVDAGRA